jgi:signal transduction histidine kinase
MLATLLPLERAKTDRDLLTERARSDDMLASRDNFVEMVSHDLRNLLCDIMLEASLLAEGASDSEEGQRIVDGMHRFERSAARMRGLIGDLVDVVSIDAGKLSVRPARGDVSALLHEAVEMFGPAARKQAMVLRCECDDQVLWAQFDGHRMLQVLANLLTNALKFTPRGGTIVVRGERSGDGVLVSVTDTGMGIPSDQIENVFKRFWQVAEDDRRGLGLGLYICRCIIDAHGGKIWAESRPGGGSSFLAMLPAAVSQVA